MNNRNLPGERLAGLLADTLHKVQHGGLTLDELALFNQRKNPFGNEHVIDCDADPFVPDGWSVEEHRKGGAFKWNKGIQKDALYFLKGQQGGKRIEGNQLRKELAGVPLLNANVLDCLLAHPYLIPEEWKSKVVFFLGTIYRDQRDFLRVRCLCSPCRDASGWHSRAGWLGSDWRGTCFAAVFAPEVQQS